MDGVAEHGEAVPGRVGTVLEAALDCCWGLRCGQGCSGLAYRGAGGRFQCWHSKSGTATASYPVEDPLPRRTGGHPRGGSRHLMVRGVGVGPVVAPCSCTVAGRDGRCGPGGCLRRGVPPSS